MLYLHPNPQETLSPLLETQLPYSLSPLGAIVFQSSLPQPHPFPAWASFPPSSLPSPPSNEPWLVLVAQAPPSRLQLRLYCSLELVPESERTKEQLERAEELVSSSVREIKGTELWKGGEQIIVGAVNSLWLKCLGYEAPHLFGIWLAREEQEHAEKSKKGEEKVEGGVVLRLGEIEDVDEIIATSKIPRSRPYIQSLLPFSSIASLPSTTTTSSPNSEPSTTPGSAVAWILTHSDCSLGTLYTQASYRRKGLARRVVEHRLANGNGVRGFCFVETGNLASEGLWKTMGWTLGWQTAWVYFE